MKILWIILGVLAGLCVLGGVLVFLIGFVRAFRVQDMFKNEDVESVVARNRDAIRRGCEILENAPHEEIHIRAFDGVELYATYFPAPDDAPNKGRGTILAVHGFRSQNPYTDIGLGAVRFLADGWDVLIPCLRGHGKSSGKCMGFAFLDRHDIAAWCHWLDKNKAPRCIILDGVSMGGGSVLMACGEDLPKSVRGVIADCGFTSAWQEMLHLSDRVFHFRAYPVFWVTSLLCKLFLGEGLFSCDTRDIMKKNTIPVFFAHGKDDNYVPWRMSVENHDACAAKKWLFLVEGAGHGESYLVDGDGYREGLKEFFAVCEGEVK